MPPQDPVQVFTPEVRTAFEAFLNGLCTTNRNFINATKRAQYLLFLADPEQKISEKDKTEKNNSMEKNAGQSKNFV